ncbi:MAG TPA: phytoene/squalene synthase family protein [Devosiaceae bacterium]|nr:phytoene/squalene synthase family protein [Devosiaceae bacterium]
MSPESSAQVAATLRELDRDRYFATLVLPDQARAAVTALYAFSAEVASVRERAREPMPGEIRLQWWKDALTGAGHGEVRQNPIADGLLSAIGEFHLPTPPLVRLIEARRFDLYHDPMPDMATFEGYAGETVSVLHQLAAMVLNGGQPVEAGDAAGHLGVAQALTGHLRAFGYNAAHGRIFLPWSVFAANGVSEAEVLAGQTSEGLLSARRQLIELARDHLAKAEAAIAALPPRLKPAFATAALPEPQLRRIAAAEPFALPPDLQDWRKLALLAWRRWSGR